MVVIVSAIIIFILMCASATLAFVVPVKQPITNDDSKLKTNSVLWTLAQYSKNVPAIIDVIG